MIYFFVWSLCFLVSLYDMIKHSSVSKNGYKFLIFIMIFMVSFRYEVGTDWNAYLSMYENSWDERNYEIGYYYLNNLSNYLGLHFNIFLFIISTISIILITKFLKFAGALSGAAILMFYSDLFLYLNFSGMRQAIALAITCFSVRYAINRSPGLFFSFVVLASTFHASAFVFFAAYFVPRGRLTFFQIVWITAVVGGAALLAPSIAGLIDSISVKSVLYYVDGIEVADELFLNFYFGIIKRISVIAVIWMLWKDLKKLPYIYYIQNMYIIGVMIYIFTYTISADIGVRVSAYFQIFDCVLIGLAVIHTKSQSNRIGLLIFVCAFSLYKVSLYAANPFYKYNFLFNFG
jgi:hypothetical protein